MSERVKLKLKYIKCSQNIYNPQYLSLYFKDDNNKDYTWSFKEPPKSFINHFNYDSGDEVWLSARVADGNKLKYVKFN